MEYFKSGLKSVLGAPQEGVQPTGAETVERLVDRVQSSTLLDDRRDACRALKALSRKYRIEVGAQAMDALCQVLQSDNGDCEIVGYALDTLVNIMAPETFEDEESPSINPTCLANLGEQFTEIFIKQVDNVALALGFLEEYDFRVRWPSVKLLTSLLANKPKDIQEIVLVSPMGVSKLMDLLSDSREVIRNDALLLLIQLTKGNANIQKIVAFENAFDRLFDVIKEEGYSDGGIVVEDCLLLMLNLLRNNTSNQNFFKEGSYIQRLAPMFNLPPEGEDNAWSPQKLSNVHCMLQVVRTLVMPGNPAQVTSSSQRSMKNCGLLEALCNILMASGVPADILTETINSVGEVIRGNQGNQEYFANVMAPSNPPRPAIVVLLMSMVNEKQPFVLRCAVLYCFQCFLFKNEVGQAMLVNTLIPSSSDVGSPTLTTGQLLCGGLFSGDALSNWYSAVALSHALVENPAQKEHLLRVLLSTNMGGAPISLIHQCTLLLQQGNKVQSKLGFLMLLSTWMSHCPLAVQHFLSIPTSIPYLTAQVGSNEHDDNEELVQGMCAFLMGICVTFNEDSVSSFTKEKLCQLISKRIGLETFLDRLGEVSKHELYSKAAKHPHLRPQQPCELLLDHEFCRLFKALEGMVIKAVTPKRDGDMLNGSMSAADNGLLRQYKDLIRDQDREMKDIAQHLALVSHEKSRLEGQVEELSSVVSQLRDQNMLLRAQTNPAFASTAVNVQETPGTQPLGPMFNSQGNLIKPFNENGNQLPSVQDASEFEMEISKLRLDSERKQSQIRALETQVKMLTIAARPAGHDMGTADSTTNRTDEEIRLSTELQDSRRRLESAQRRIKELEETVGELERVRKDQEDLLELLTDQDLKINEFKARLRALGEKLEDDDESLSGEEDLDQQLQNSEVCD